jgi:hypothetical protein
MGKSDKLPQEILLKDLSIMHVKPEDLIVVRPNVPMNQEKMMKLHKGLQYYKEKQNLKMNFMIFDHKTDIGVLRPEKDSEKGA